MRLLMVFCVCFLLACGDDDGGLDSSVDAADATVDLGADAIPDAMQMSFGDEIIEQEQKYVTLYCECSETPDCESVSIINQLTGLSVTQLECVKRGAEAVHSTAEQECFVANMKSITDCMESTMCAEDRFACISENGQACVGEQKLFALSDAVKAAANQGCSEAIP